MDKDDADYVGQHGVRELDAVRSPRSFWENGCCVSYRRPPLLKSSSSPVADTAPLTTLCSCLDALSLLRRETYLESVKRDKPKQRRGGARVVGRVKALSQDQEGEMEDQDQAWDVVWARVLIRANRLLCFQV